RISSEELDDETLDELIDFRRSTFEYHSQQGNKVQTIIHGVTLTAMIELKERRAAMLQDAENSESHSGIQASPALNFLPKKPCRAAAILRLLRVANVEPADL
ncbi:hypothetical protein UXN58_22325, partial [Enterobacter hormaechei]